MLFMLKRFSAFIFLITCAALGHAQDSVILTDDGSSFALSNGIVNTKIDKNSASLLTFRYKDHELLGPMGIDGFWSLPASNMEFGSKRDTSVILDPKTNNGERAIVAVHFGFDGDAKSVPAD